MLEIDLWVWPGTRVRPVDNEATPTSIAEVVTLATRASKLPAPLGPSPGHLRLWRSYFAEGTVNLFLPHLH